MSENVNFEDNMKQLEQIAGELEKGDLDLDASVKKFVKSVVRCLKEQKKRLPC